MSPHKGGQKRRKERNPIKMEEMKDSVELGESSEDSAEVVRGKKGRKKEQKKFIGAHVSIAGKTQTAHF